MKTLKYFTLDVFTKKKFQGNPLSVVWCEEELDISQYQNIAREFGYAETSFAQLSSDKSVFKVRSFTPGGFEVNGAGHNLLGAVFLAVLKGWNKLSDQEIQFSVTMKGKKIPIVISEDKPGIPYVAMRQQHATIESIIMPDVIAPAVGLNADILSIGKCLPMIVKTEVAHLMVPVKDKYHLDLAVINKPVLNAIAKQEGFQGCYLFTMDGVTGDGICEARFFNPGIGIDEDAATGSAAGPLAGYLQYYEYIQPNVSYNIIQGVKMKQPSVINIKIAEDGIWVSGTGVLIMDGVLYL